MTITPVTPELDYFPIRILSELTGVNSVTLRAWERRYGLLKPFRTEKGHRLYCREDIGRVNKILYWVNQGVSVGKVKVLLDSNQEPSQMVINDAQWPDWQAMFIHAVTTLDQAKWEQLFQDASKQYPIQVLLQKGLLPALVTLGNQPDAVVSRLCLQSSLTELILSIKSSYRHTRFAQDQSLIFSADHSSLMARLLAWTLSEAEHSFKVLEGVRTAQDVIQVAQHFAPQQVILVAESITQGEAERWLNVFEQSGLPLMVIGSGFWLAGKSMTLGKHIELYSDLMDYFS